MMQVPEVEFVFAQLQRRADDMEEHWLEAKVYVNCAEDQIILWQSFTDDPVVAEPISVEDFLVAAEPLQYAQERMLRVLITADQRADGGALDEWEVGRYESVGAEQVTRERVLVNSMIPTGVVSFFQNGDDWLLTQRGWDIRGSLPDEPLLPLEVLIAQTEPSMTADLLRAHRDEITDVGEITLQRELESLPSELEVAMQSLQSPIAEQTFKVDIVDGSVVRSRYRIVDETGNKILSPEIRYVEFQRTYPIPERFHLPRQHNAGDYQYRLPDPLPPELTYLSRSRGDDGMSETYQLRWQDVPLGLVAEPSRSGLAPDARGDRWSANWETHVEEYSHGNLIWVDPEGSGYPAMALWDTGWYRFQLSVNVDAIPADGEWSVDRLIEVVELLSEPWNHGDGQ